MSDFFFVWEEGEKEGGREKEAGLEGRQRRRQNTPEKIGNVKMKVTAF